MSTPDAATAPFWAGTSWAELAEHADQRGLEHHHIRDHVLGAVHRGIAAHPRSGQREIGPSEIGHPCDRWLAYRLNGTPHTGVELPPWRQAVGTAVHTAFSDWLTDANDDLGDRPWPRWYTDMRVDVGELRPGRPIHGHLDLYDLATATVIDLKVVGAAQLKIHSNPAKPESPQYRIQTQLYARGATRLGLPVDQVAVLRVPASGELHEAAWRCAPYDETAAVDALERAGAIAGLVDAIGADAPAAYPTTDHYCGRCPWYAPGSTDIHTGCPGDPGASVNRPDPIHDLIAGTQETGEAA